LKIIINVIKDSQTLNTINDNIYKLGLIIIFIVSNKKTENSKKIINVGIFMKKIRKIKNRLKK